MSDLLYRAATHIAAVACANFVFFLAAEFLMANSMVGVAHTTRRDVETTLLVISIAPAIIGIACATAYYLTSISRRTASV